MEIEPVFPATLRKYLRYYISKWMHVQHCPYHHGTDREFECSRSITPRQVITTIERLRRDLLKDNQ
ncbi:MAG: hypothetical protein E7198_11175 [Schwartzia succinivorans]|nr:hypothetical protein [Schwartzia succinivorans]